MPSQSQWTPRETNLTSPPRSVLLDKGVVRRVYEARVRMARGHPPTLLQAEASNAYARLRGLDIRLYITLQTAHILHGRPAVFAAAVLNQTHTLQKARYLRRWARRACERLAFRLKMPSSLPMVVLVSICISSRSASKL